jgi:glycosyltransferase involved in cell wall biosynthesis
MKILINSLSITDSGGISVFSKLLDECVEADQFSFLVVCHDSKNIRLLIPKYEKYSQLEFLMISNKGMIHRLLYENFVFKQIIKKRNIQLVYNFSGTAQLFSTVPQIIKIHNLLFYSKRLDKAYFSKRLYIKWVKQIFLKRLVLLILLHFADYIEVQSEHVKASLSDFMRIDNKHFFIKSDILIQEKNALQIRCYNNAPIVLLFIVGPHFTMLHKNISDFLQALYILDEKKVEYTINITLTKEQLEETGFWDEKFNSKTNFLGYLPSSNEVKALFQDNTILVSTSIIETLGLHVIEATLNGVLCIVPNEPYAHCVYGKNILSYDLFSPLSLANTIYSTISRFSKNQEMFYAKIQQQQQYLITNESRKMSNISKMFSVVIGSNHV